jgi:hypothetical protein
MIHAYCEDQTAEDARRRNEKAESRGEAGESPSAEGSAPPGRDAGYGGGTGRRGTSITAQASAGAATTTRGATLGDALGAVPDLRLKQPGVSAAPPWSPPPSPPDGADRPSGSSCPAHDEP